LTKAEKQGILESMRRHDMRGFSFAGQPLTQLNDSIMGTAENGLFPFREKL
jgi:hypothetical protein